MKRFILIFLCLTVILCACTSMQDQKATVGTTQSTTSPTASTAEVAATAPIVTFEAPLVAVSMPISKVESKSDDGTLLYTHTTQSFSLILPDPDAAQMITNDFLNQTNLGSSAARLVHEAAVEDYKGQDDWVPYEYSNLYAPVRLDQNILSLFGTELIFDGSAGSASVKLSATYDLLTGNALEEVSQILVADYSADALCQLIYAELNDLSKEGILYADYEYTISDMFSTNTPVQNWYLNATGLCFYFMPYEIAPHSVGTIIAEIPYSSLNGLLQDRYFPAETVNVYGEPVVQSYSDSVTYAQLAELTIAENAQQYMLYANGALFDVEIGFSSSTETADKMAETIFAAASIGTGDMVLISCNELNQLLLRYRANGEFFTVPLLDYLMDIE